jgi:hypothetical protein
VGWNILVEEEPAEFFACAENLTSPWTAPPVIHCRQVEQLERARQGAIEARAIVCVVRPNGAVDFTADVRQLFHQAE